MDHVSRGALTESAVLAPAPAPAPPVVLLSAPVVRLAMIVWQWFEFQLSEYFALRVGSCRARESRLPSGQYPPQHSCLHDTRVFKLFNHAGGTARM